MGTRHVSGSHAAQADAVEGKSAPSLSSQPSGELVRELSQLQYRLRAWSGIDTPGWEERAGVDLQSLWARSEEIRRELESRGVDSAEGGDHQPATPRPQSSSLSFQADSAVSLEETVRHLERAVVTRTVIGEAKGILMERHNMTADEALEELRLISNMTNRKLREVAMELVRTRSLPGVASAAGDGAPVREGASTQEAT